MIVPMKKVCLMVQDKSREEALKKLRDVGVVHLEKKDAAVDNNSFAFKCKAKVEEAIGLISEYKLPKKKKNSGEASENQIERREKPVGLHRGRRATDVYGTEDEEPFSLSAVTAPKRPYLPDLMVGYGEERKTLRDQIVALGREAARIEAWGDFDISALKDIVACGVPVYLYEISPDVLANLDNNINYIKVKSDNPGDKATVRVAVFYEKILGINPFQLPEKRLSEYQEELQKHSIDLKNVEDKLKSFVDRRLSLDKEMEKINTELEFEAAVAGMEEVEDVPSELGLSWLTGYVPAEELEKVKVTAKENGWALSAYDPNPSDLPPTKLKSNSFARIIQPLFSFLGTFPGYREFDISLSYLIFFSIFFAMILGDAGYGLLIFIVAAFLGLNIKKKTGAVPDIVKLLMLLTFTTVLWGAFNGSWFAIPQKNLPPFLTALILPPFNNMGPVVEFPAFLQDLFKLPAEVPVDEFKTRWYIQFLCFSLALVQLVLARGKRMLKLLPSLTAFAQFGVLVMMIGLYFLVLNMLLGIAFPPFAIWLILAGVVINLIFAQQNGGNFFANIGKGLGGLFQLFLKAVSCFADIISYIRLFAVGLAGAMIAQIFNNMAIPEGGDFGSFGLIFILKLVMTVLILAAGHGLNLALTTLSVIVHGVRLNLLEYAGNHLEMEWSGYLYKPFALKQKDK